MAINMMKQGGYRDAYAAALTASTAILGPIIPPSIIMIVYAMTDSNVTVTGLFLAGVVPGLSLIHISLTATSRSSSIGSIAASTCARSSPGLLASPAARPR